MSEVILQIALLIAAGIVWRQFQPAGLSAQAVRSVLTSLVFYLLLPAFALLVLWTAEWRREYLLISLLGVAGVLGALLVMWLFGRLWKFPRPSLGAMMLAAAFPNVTYMGLPVLESTFGDWARAVVMQYDLFAATPLLFTVGIMVGVSYGNSTGKHEPVWRTFAAMPYIWGAALALLMNVLDIDPPDVLLGSLRRLVEGIAPLMLIAVGLALNPRRLVSTQVLTVVPVVLLQLVLVPLALWPLAAMLGMRGEWLQAFVLEAAMPTMLFGLVICDRYGMDTELYATAVTLTTVTSLVSLPLWYHLLQTTAV
jgi:predicted permease